jgi:hypothetical protein
MSRLREWNRDQIFYTTGRRLGMDRAEVDMLIQRHALAMVSSAGDDRHRVTVTRFAVLGLLAFAARKRAGHVVMTFDVDGRPARTVQCKARDETKAREWAAEFNGRAEP